MDDLLDQLSDPKRAAGGGSAAALSGAMAAALGVLTLRLMKIDPQRFIDHRGFFQMAADRDAQAFAGLMRSANPPHDALMEATEAPLRIAERAHNLHEDLQRVAAIVPTISLRCNHGDRVGLLGEIGRDRNRGIESVAPYRSERQVYSSKPG